MNAKKDPKPTPKEQANNTLGIDGLSTHPNVPSKRTNTELPIEFGRYRLLKVLGEGGMGAVYLAHDTELDRKVALKLPHFVGGKSRDQGERFRREARLAATLDHANICRIHDIGEQDGSLYLTMQYVEGKTLNDLIKAKGAIEPRTAVNLVKRIASAVQVAHAQGIIHRDLKPANIMIKKDRDFVIMDFGLARRVDQEEVQLTATGAVLGTPAYMAPEQFRGENNAVGPQSDVYSLGIILYELLTGERPFQGTLPQIYAQVLSTDSVFPSSVKTGLDAALDEICRKATSANTGARYRTVEEFAKALGGYLSGQSQAPSDSLASIQAIGAIEAPFASYQPTIKKPQSVLTTHRNPIAIGAVVGIAALALLGAFLLRRSSTGTVDDSFAKREVTPPATTTPVLVPSPNTSPPAALNGQSFVASTTESPNATSGQLQENNTNASPAQNDAQRPGLVWSSPPSKIWWRCATYSPKGNYVAASGENRDFPKTEFSTIRVWPVRDDQRGNDSFVLRHPTPNTWVSAMNFSPDGRRLASATLNGSVAIWDMDATTPSLLSTFHRFEEKIIGLAFSPDGRFFATGARKAGVPFIVWDLADVRQPKEAFRCTLPDPDEPCSFAFSKDSKALFIGAGVRGKPGNLFKWVFETERSAKAIWSAPPGLDTHWVRALNIAKDGKTLVLAFGSSAFIVDASTGREIKKLTGHSKEVQAVQLSQSAESCLTGSVDQTLRLYSVSTGNEVWRNEVPTGPNEGLAISPDDQYAFSSSRGSQTDPMGFVQFWRLPKTALSRASQSTQNASQNARKSGAILEEMQGEWRCIATEEIGVKFDDETTRRHDRRLSISRNNLSMTRTTSGPRGTYTGKFDVDGTNNHFDFIGKGPSGSAVEWIGLVKLDGDRLTLCYRYVSDANAKRPSTFETDSSRPNISVCYQYQRVGKPE